jgi:hypothetical protein
MLERFQEDALRDGGSEKLTGINIDVGVGRTTASLGVVRAERYWYRDENGVFGLWEDAYGRAVGRLYEEHSQSDGREKSLT